MRRKAGLNHGEVHKILRHAIPGQDGLHERHHLRGPGEPALEHPAAAAGEVVDVHIHQGMGHQRNIKMEPLGVDRVVLFGLAAQQGAGALHSKAFLPVGRGGPVAQLALAQKTGLPLFGLAKPMGEHIVQHPAIHIGGLIAAVVRHVGWIDARALGLRVVERGVIAGGRHHGGIGQKCVVLRIQERRGHQHQKWDKLR